MDANINAMAKAIFVLFRLRLHSCPSTTLRAERCGFVGVFGPRPSA
jgi:hypothetical protein